MCLGPLPQTPAELHAAMVAYARMLAERQKETK